MNAMAELHARCARAARLRLDPMNKPTPRFISARSVDPLKGGTVGFLAASYLSIGGTETFHRTLLPRLRFLRNITGFVATSNIGCDGSKLMVPYFTGIDAARNLASKVDIIVTWGIETLSEILPENRPKVISVHHADWSSQWSNNCTLNQLDLIDEVVCVNQDVAERMTECGKPTRFIPNAIDPRRLIPTGRQHELHERFGIPADSKIVLFGHRLSTEKRPRFAIEIADNLPDEWVMIIVGDGPELAAVKQLAESSGRVIVTGPAQSLADWLSVSDCFLSLAEFEGFGLAIGEAMLFGVPTVSTPTGIAPGLAITLDRDATAAEWANAINNSHTWQQPVDLADKFNCERMVNAWSDLIGDLSK